jgi:hypothetical protein
MMHSFWSVLIILIYLAKTSTIKNNIDTLLDANKKVGL